jgi:Ca-activated chloride channel family protein
MKSAYAGLIGLTFFAVAGLAHGNGVWVVDASDASVLVVSGGEVVVSIDDQIAIVRATIHCHNQFSEGRLAKYGFPMPEGASATSLRWRIGGVWREAAFSSSPQDTTLPGPGTVDPRLDQYLGETPLFFGIRDTVAADSMLVVELTYVQLLPYRLGNVEFEFPSSYEPLPLPQMNRQSLTLKINSSRTIEFVDLSSHIGGQISIDGHRATVHYEIENASADRDYRLRYRLSLDELGLFAFSTMIPDSAAVDSLGTGFFTFVAEPDPGENVDVIQKAFTLIVDRSGSMSGDKIVQARNAASFVVNNLNEGDEFNIVDFSSDVLSFRPALVPFTSGARAAALDYISTFQASGMTNISGAFSTAVPQFSSVGDTTAAIIVFFTDGLPTAGMTDPAQILEHIGGLIVQNERPVTIFTFGVGRDVNYQLLTLIASQNSGLATFLESDELEERISDFYLQIRNPVLLNTEIVIDPPTVSEIFPNPLPNLYKGQQMIVSGRYAAAEDVTVLMAGTAFGRDVSYTYQLSLSDSLQQRLLFLPKIWAKQKIEHLLVRYYSLDQSSTEAGEIKDEIVALSLAYGVISPFTSFREQDSGGRGFGGTVETEDVDGPRGEVAIVTVEAFPNPFASATTIRFHLSAARPVSAVVRIYDSLGRLVRILAVNTAGPGSYEVVWDGRNGAGQRVGAGTYIYTVTTGEAVLAGTVTLVPGRASR